MSFVSLVIINVLCLWKQMDLGIEGNLHHSLEVGDLFVSLTLMQFTFRTGLKKSVSELISRYLCECNPEIIAEK